MEYGDAACAARSVCVLRLPWCQVKQHGWKETVRRSRLLSALRGEYVCGLSFRMNHLQLQLTQILQIYWI